MIDFGSNETFIENYKKLKSSRKMGELYNCDKSSILNHAKKIGYDPNQDKEIKITQLSPEEMIELYEKIQNCAEIGKLYNCSSTAVINYLHKIGYSTLKNSNNKLTDINEETFIKNYEILKSAKKMGELYGCSSTAILNYCKKIQYNPNENKQYKLNDADKEDIINSYYTSSSTELAKKYNVSRGMITKLWHDNNLFGKEILPIKTTEIDLTGQKFGKWTVLYKTNLRTSSGGIYWHCKCECGIEKNVSSLTLRNGTSLSCGSHSNISKGNEKIKQILLENNIPFKTEKTFDTCQDKRKLPFDFYVESKYVIEYDGLQHYDEKTIFDYNYTNYHDTIKTQWCKNNNIPLIRIPYYHYNNLTIEDLKLETTNFRVC